MSSLGFGSSGGGGFGIPTSTPSSGGAVAAPHHSSLLGGLVHDAFAIPEHLASDIGTAAVNLPVGLYQIGKTAVTDPSKLPDFVKGIVKQYEDYYGHDVLHHLYEHPLQPILDGLTLVSGGLAATAKFGELANIDRFANLAKRSEIVTRSPQAVKTEGLGPTVTKLTSDRPITKVRQLATHRVGQAIDDWVQQRTAESRGIGPKGTRPIEFRRYGKEIQRRETQAAIGRSDLLRPYEAVLKKLSPEEKLALNTRSMGVHPDALSEVWSQMGDTQNAADIARPGVRDLILNPSERMQTAEPFWRAISGEGAELLKLRGALSHESEIDRPGRFRDMAAQWLGRDAEDIALPGAEPYYIPHTTLGEKGGSHPLSDVGGGKALPRALGSMKQNTGELFRMGKLDLQNDVLGPEFLRRVKWLKFHGIHQSLKRGALRVTWDELHRMDASGRPPKGWDFLRTDVPQRESQRIAKSITRIERIQARNPTDRGAATLKKLYARHADLVTGEVPDRYLGYTRQKIPFSVRSEGEHPMDLQHLIPDAQDLQSSRLAEGFTTGDHTEALQDESGRYFLVPKSMSKAATGEFTRMSKAMYVMNKYPLRMWRSLLLGLRPAFLVNNLLGNSLMYAVKTGGTGAVRDLFQAFRETHGDALAQRLLKDASTKPYRQDLIREFYPEQMSGGTFGRTQSPAAEGLLRGAHTKAGAGFEAVTGAIPRLTANVAEERLRRALVRNYIRRSPEFKAVYRTMPSDTRSFDNAARQIHEGKGGVAFQRMISEQVDRSIGNYTALTAFERNVMRNLLPFYAWYRAIVNTTLHLGLDNPLRANLLYRLGAIGAETAVGQVGGLALPSYLQGAIPIGTGPQGTQRLLSTQSLNPWATLQQLGRGLTADWTSLGLNPFIEGAGQALTKLSSGPGAHKAISPGDIFNSMISTIVKGLPPMAQVLPSKPSKLYPTKGRGDIFAGIPVLGNREAALSAWGGIPIKEPDLGVAAQYAAEGQ